MTHPTKSLIGFQLGGLDEASRREVEVHLVDCRDCLAQFLALKRSVEGAPADDARPSAAARARLRAAVAQAVGASAAPRWWERPLTFGVAFAAVLIAFVSVKTVSTAPATAPLGVASARLDARP